MDRDSIVISDGLGCFASVDYDGCGHETVISSGEKAEENHRHFKLVNTMIGNVKKTPFTEPIMPSVMIIFRDILLNFVIVLPVVFIQKK